MRAISVVAVLGAVLGAGAGGSAGAVVPAPAPALKPGHVLAAIDTCHPALSAAGRYFVVSGQMAAIPRSAAMAIRFDLQQRTHGSGPFRRVNAPGLGVWHRSAAGVQLFRHSQDVTNLSAPASFRAVIAFRWYGASGKVVKRARRRTVVCQMPDQRPRLAIGEVSRSPGGTSPGGTSRTTRYDVVVRNDGLGAASGFNVLLSINGVAEPEQAVSGLAPRERKTVMFIGPPCPPGRTLNVTLDPKRQVDQTTRAGDAKTVAC
jgi:hypothetical protein